MLCDGTLTRRARIHTGLDSDLLSWSVACHSFGRRSTPSLTQSFLQSVPPAAPVWTEWAHPYSPPPESLWRRRPVSLLDCDWNTATKKQLHHTLYMKINTTSNFLTVFWNILTFYWRATSWRVQAPIQEEAQSADLVCWDRTPAWPIPAKLTLKRMRMLWMNTSFRKKTNKQSTLLWEIPAEQRNPVCCSTAALISSTMIAPTAKHTSEWPNQPGWEQVGSVSSHCCTPFDRCSSIYT